jgi:hypothetical protein
LISEKLRHLALKVYDTNAKRRSPPRGPAADWWSDHGVDEIIDDRPKRAALDDDILDSRRRGILSGGWVLGPNRPSMGPGLQRQGKQGCSKEHLLESTTCARLLRTYLLLRLIKAKHVIIMMSVTARVVF